MNSKRGRAEAAVVMVLVVLVFVVIALFAWGCPQYVVWQQGKSGEAELARAEANRRIVITEAEAAEAAATHRAEARIAQAKAEAEAEIERAKGVAKANEIIGASLKGNESYLRYLWISGMQSNRESVIYIPTEAGIPILEAGRGTKPPAELTP